jgi:hypothetical protein
VKALSIKQPWANMICSGEKTIETRLWHTPYRGELLIVSSKRPAIPPNGYALAVARLVDCRPMQLDDESAACCDLYDGAYSWVLADVQPIELIPVRGQLGLYDVCFLIQHRPGVEPGHNQKQADAAGLLADAKAATED